MKTFIITILCGCAIHFASSMDIPIEGLTFGKRCEIPNQCKSQQCTPICESTNNEKACTEPDWYYVRHVKEIPTCVPLHFLSRKITSLAYSKKRRVGYSCHNDNNCQSRHCLPSCDTSTNMWRCEPPR